MKKSCSSVLGKLFYEQLLHDHHLCLMVSMSNQMPMQSLRHKYHNNNHNNDHDNNYHYSYWLSPNSDNTGYSSPMETNNILHFFMKNYSFKKYINDSFKKLLSYYDRIYIQSNLCIATTLGTGKKWSLFRGGRYSEGQLVKLFFF